MTDKANRRQRVFARAQMALEQCDPERQSAIANEIEDQAWNVILAEGCLNRLETLIDALLEEARNESRTTKEA